MTPAEESLFFVVSLYFVFNEEMLEKICGTQGQTDCYDKKYLGDELFRTG
jgi:hypothetical protein